MREKQDLQQGACLQEHRNSVTLPQHQQQQLAADITLPLVASGTAAGSSAVQCGSELLQAVRQQQQLLQWLVLQQQQQQAAPDDRDLMELALVSIWGCLGCWLSSTALLSSTVVHWLVQS
jgi:hypothetical protein